MRTAGRQPRILLTNVKQLELLLTRQRDVELFENAGLDFLLSEALARPRSLAELPDELEPAAGRPVSEPEVLSDSAVAEALSGCEGVEPRTCDMDGRLRGPKLCPTGSPNGEHN